MLASDLEELIVLESYFLPGDLWIQTEAFFEHYNLRELQKHNPC